MRESKSLFSYWINEGKLNIQKPFFWGITGHGVHGKYRIIVTMETSRNTVWLTRPLEGGRCLILLGKDEVGFHYCLWRSWHHGEPIHICAMGRQVTQQTWASLPWFGELQTFSFIFNTLSFLRKKYWIEALLVSLEPWGQICWHLHLRAGQRRGP